MIKEIKIKFTKNNHVLFDSLDLLSESSVLVGGEHGIGYKGRFIDFTEMIVNFYCCLLYEKCGLMFDPKNDMHMSNFNKIYAAFEMLLVRDDSEVMISL